MSFGYILYEVLFRLKVVLYWSIFVFLSAVSHAQESHFFRLEREEVLQKGCLPEEVLSLKERLGVPEENCHFFFEEVSLMEEDGGKFYWDLPVAEELNYAYRQPVAVRICHDTVHFLQDYDYDSVVHLKKFPNGFVLKRAMPFQERATDDCLVLAPKQSLMFVSLTYITPPLWDTPQPVQICIIIHQVLPTDGTSDVSLTWNFKEAIAEAPKPSIPSFILPVPLDGRPTAEIPHVDIKLEGSVLKKVSDNSVFTFPPGEYILKIQVDGVTFPVFWHQKENSLPYRVFFFNAISYDQEQRSLFFNRMTYPRFLNTSGGCLLDASALLASESGDPKLFSGMWFLGTASDNFHLKFAKIIRTIIGMQNIPERNVLLMGSSMGGFMAFKMAEYLTESSVFSYNPQIDYPVYTTSNTWRKGYGERVFQYLCGSVNLLYCPFELRNRMIIHPKKVVNRKRIVLYIQNMADTHHYERHFLLFLHQVKRDPNIKDLLSEKIRLPLSDFRHGLVVFLFNDPVSGHNSIGRDFELPIIDSLLRFMAGQMQNSTPNVP